MQLTFPWDSADDVQFIRMRRARRYILRVRPDGTLRVTIPRGGSRSEAIAFMGRHLSWVAAERARVERQRVSVPPEREAELREQARQQLVPRLHEFATQHGLTFSRVTIRNQRSRWGSCSRRGAIALNYRLVLMPPEIADYVLIHELMHLKEQNHGRQFWRLVEAAYPAFRDAERWLRTNGRSLF